MSKIRKGNDYFEVGVGFPIHIAKKGTIYSDVNSGNAYINKDSLSNWSLLTDVVLTGGTGGSGGIYTGDL